MFSTTDTIVAIATPPGRGGIGVIRVSGGDALPIARQLLTCRHPLEPRRATFTRVREVAARPASVASRAASTSSEQAIDHVVATYFPGPASYTGEDVVEVSAHGSPVILQAIVAAVMAHGARLAEPGEFTLRAFLHGRVSLVEAEAVGDLVDAVTPLQARAAFDQLQGTLTAAIARIDAALFDLIARLEASVDFPDEGYHFAEPAGVAGEIDAIAQQAAALLAEAARGRLVREGLQVAIVGPPNVGKSSLFNALVGSARAIVSAVPGTTRDLVTEVVDLDGLRVTLVDTAGQRATADEVENEGVSRAKQAQAIADVTLLVLDGSMALDPAAQSLIDSQTSDKKTVIVSNKSDLPAAWTRPEAVRVSARTRDGVRRLQQTLLEVLDVVATAERPAITNLRHISLVAAARDALLRARDAVSSRSGALSEEFVLADLQTARAALDEIVGRRTPDDVLKHIFARFCIGK